MPNIETLDINRGTLVLHGEEFRDEVLNFAAADTILIGTILARITASGKLTPYVVGGANGAGVPVAVLTYEVARTSAGDEYIRALVKGTVNRNRLIIDADGNGNNLTNAILDQLRDMGIVPIDVQTL